MCFLGILILLLILSCALRKQPSKMIVIHKPVPVNIPVPVPALVSIEKVAKPGPLIDDIKSMYYSDLEWYAPLYSSKRPFSSNYYNGSYKTYV